MANWWDRAVSIAGDFVQGRGAAQSVDPVLRETQEMHDLKAELLTQVRAEAGDAWPTLEAYRKSTEAFAQTERGQAMVAAGKWSPQIAADLSGQNLDNFLLTEPKVLAGMKDKSAMLEADYDSFDRDGDGQINVHALNKFYDSITLNGTSLRDAMVEPATSFNDQIAKANNRSGMIFSGMENGQTFTFAQGQYENVAAININGGGFHFGQGTQVNGLKLDGKTAEITIDANARVEHISTNDHFRIVTLHSKGTIASSDLSNAVVGQNSKLRGATLQDVKLGEVNGLDLSGATLNNLTIQGTPITKMADLREFGVSADATTRVSASPTFLREHALAEQATKAAQQQAALQKDLGDVIAKLKVATDMTTPARPPAQTAGVQQPDYVPLKKLEAWNRPPTQNELDAAPKPASNLRITGGETVRHDEVALTKAVAEMAKPPELIAAQAAQAQSAMPLPPRRA